VLFCTPTGGKTIPIECFVKEVAQPPTRLEKDILNSPVEALSTLEVLVLIEVVDMT